MTFVGWWIGIVVVLLLGTAGLGNVAVAESAEGQRTEDFRVDPEWEDLHNRRLPDPLPLKRQDFGYSRTRHAGGQSAGEIGGMIQRSLTPAYYAQAIAEKTFRDRLHASGKFAVTQAEGGSGMLFGWFNDKSRGWRTPNSLAFRVDGNGGKYWVFFG